MSTLKWYMIYALLGYGALVALLYFSQRAIQYFPERLRTAPAAAGLPQAQEVVLDTSDGEHVIAWHVPPRGHKPVVLYFHGNGGSLRMRVDRFRDLTAARRDALIGTPVEVLVDRPGIGRSHREAPEIDGVVRLDAAWARPAALGRAPVTVRCP